MGGKGGYEAEARKLKKTHIQTGMLRSNDQALIFLQTMPAKMKEPEKGGNRLPWSSMVTSIRGVSLQIIIIKAIMIARSVGYIMLNQYPVS